MYWPFKTSTHSQSKIFSLKAVIVACSLCSYTVAFQDRHTLPKRNILSHSCYCGLLSLLVYSGLSGPAHPPKEKYSLKAVIVACSVYLRFRTSTPSQREIFSQSCYCGLLVWSFLSGPAHPPKEKYSLNAVIVACSYGVSFQDQHTLPKRNILSKLLLWLALCIYISGSAHPPKVKYSLSQLLL